MTRLFYVSGDVELARRTLKLYSQVVGKAWETAKADSLQTGEEIYAGNDSDLETNRNWVETLVQGSRMLCRLSCSKVGSVVGTTGSGMEEVKEAGILIDKAKIRLDESENDLVASVALAEGVWNSVLAYKGHSCLFLPGLIG